MMIRSRLFRILSCILITGILPFGGCAPKIFHVDYAGGKSAFIDAQDTYRAGQTVTLKTGVVTDEIQTVLLDGEELQTVDTEDDAFFVYRFTMPEHDVIVELRTKNISAVEPVMLVDYYEAVTAELTAKEEENGYSELVLYDDGSSELLLEEYVNGGTDDELVRRYRVPRETADLATAIIHEYRMTAWDDIEDPVSVDGMLYVCRFRDGDAYVRATSEQMPENGTEAFSALRRLLSRFLTEAYSES